MSPVQYWLLQETGLQPDLAIRVALGTSLFVVLLNCHKCYSKIPAKASSTLEAGNNYGSLRINFQFWGSGGSFSSAGLYTEHNFRDRGHNWSTQDLYDACCKEKDEISSNPVPYIFAGISIGFFSGLLGIGGGVLGIPIMLIFLHFDMLKAIGTSAAVIIFTSFGGSIGYIINGWGQPGLPPYSLGYVNLLNWILLAVPGFLAARKGAEIAHLVNPEHLKHLFVLLMTLCRAENDRNCLKTRNC